MASKKIPLYGVELSLDKNFETKELDNILKINVSKENILFQKEACINLVIDKIPEIYSKIAWIDHDAFFENDNWYYHASNALENSKLVQLFSNCIKTDDYGRVIDNRPSFVRSGIECSFNFKNSNLKSGVFGLAWASHREMWNNGGLYPYCYLGGGDGMFVHTLFDTIMTDRIKSIINMKMYESDVGYEYWKNKIRNYITKQDVAYIEGNAYHEWHGDIVDRRYATRYDPFDKVNIKNLKIDQSGILALTDVDEIVYDMIFRHFINRFEDSTENKF